MWYEILPSAGIIFVAMAFPHVSAYAVNYMFLGNTYRRSMLDGVLVKQHLRDRRISGKDNPYVVKGLESLPDK